MVNYISLRPNPIYAEIVGTCKKYDKATEQQRVNSVIGEEHTVSEKIVLCSYPKCGKQGHTAAQCLLRKKEQDGAGTLRGATGSRRRNLNHVRQLVGVVHVMCVAPRSIVLLNVLTEQTQMTEKKEEQHKESYI